MKYAKMQGFCRWFWGMTCLVCSNFTNLVMPLFIGKAIDNMNKGDFDKNGKLCGYLMISVVITAVFVGMRSYLFNSMSERIARDLRRDFFGKIVNQDIGFFDEQKSGDLLSRLNNDIQII
jgi:ABC-type multidrug transport system fused ATPase/permease subunit